MKIYKITLNKSKKTYTIREYEDGKQIAKYRSLPQGKDYTENWSQNDIANYLHTRIDYYQIKPKY